MAVEEDSSLVLPPGFRFHPTDEEIISHYLSHKVVNHGFSARAMGEVDLNKCEPWDLPSKAKMGEKEWYFFCQRDRKYPTGMRTNRATESGYWKATGKDKEIYRGTSVLVGMKKTLVFYRGRAPKGEKTNWVMHEYRLEGKFSLSNLPRNAKDEWVVCRVFCKNIVGLKRSPLHGGGGLFRVNSFMEDLLDYSPSLPALTDTAYFANSPSMPSYFSSAAADDSLKNPYALNEFPSSSTSYFQPIYGNDQISPYFSASDDMYREPSLAIRKHCKAEQLSNQSMLSHDTGVSTDHNTEISSGITTHDCLALYDQRDFEVPSNLPAGALDLCAMWRC